MQHYAAIALIWTSYVLGSPMAAPVRPDMLDKTFVSFHRGVNSGLATLLGRVIELKRDALDAAPDIARMLRQG